jgi:MFS family permease
LALLCAPAGFALVGNNQVSPIIAAKLDWNEDQADLYNTIISSCSIFGGAMGTFIAGKFVGKGRRKSAIWLNLLGIVSSALQVVWLSVIPICIGRVLFGFSSGALLTCANCMLRETVPDS